MGLSKTVERLELFHPVRPGECLRPCCHWAAGLVLRDLRLQRQSRSTGPPGTKRVMVKTSRVIPRNVRMIAASGVGNTTAWVEPRPRLLFFMASHIRLTGLSRPSITFTELTGIDRQSGSVTVKLCNKIKVETLSATRNVPGISRMIFPKTQLQYKNCYAYPSNSRF